MTFTFQLPNELELNLQLLSRDLGAEAKEALLVTLYKRGELTHKQLSLALGLERFATDEVLNKHKVTEDLPTIEDIEQQLRLSQSLASKLA